MKLNCVGILLAVASVLIALPGCSYGQKSTAGAPKSGMTVACPAFEAGQPIPTVYTRDGDDVSPAVRWTNVPAAAKSLALTCEDPDAPHGTWLHWLVYDINPRLHGLVRGVKPVREIGGQLKQGLNSWNKLGYGGPSPPRGPRHRYFFTLYALDIRLDLPGGATKQQVADAMSGHVIAKARTMGTYKR